MLAPLIPSPIHDFRVIRIIIEPFELGVRRTRLLSRLLFSLRSSLEMRGSVVFWGGSGFRGFVQEVGWRCGSGFGGEGEELAVIAVGFVKEEIVEVVMLEASQSVCEGHRNRADDWNDLRVE